MRRTLDFLNRTRDSIRTATDAAMHAASKVGLGGIHGVVYSAHTGNHPPFYAPKSTIHPRKVTPPSTIGCCQGCVSIAVGAHGDRKTTVPPRGFLLPGR